MGPTPLYTRRVPCIRALMFVPSCVHCAFFNLFCGGGAHSHADWALPLALQSDVAPDSRLEAAGTGGSTAAGTGGSTAAGTGGAAPSVPSSGSDDDGAAGAMALAFGWVGGRVVVVGVSDVVQWLRHQFDINSTCRRSSHASSNDGTVHPAVSHGLRHAAHACFAWRLSL